MIERILHGDADVERTQRHLIVFSPLRSLRQKELDTTQEIEATGRVDLHYQK